MDEALEARNAVPEPVDEQRPADDRGDQDDPVGQGGVRSTDAVLLPPAAPLAELTPWWRYRSLLA